MREAKIGNGEVVRCMGGMRDLFRRFPIAQEKIDEIFNKLRNESSVEDFVASQVMLRRGDERSLISLGKILVIGAVLKDRQSVGICSSVYSPDSGDGPWLKAMVAFGEQVRPVEFPPSDCIKHDVFYLIEGESPKRLGDF